MKTPKWKTTVMGVIGALFSVLVLVKPEIFSPENNTIIVSAIGGILTAVLSIISVFSAKDEINTDNIS